MKYTSLVFGLLVTLGVAVYACKEGLPTAANIDTYEQGEMACVVEAGSRADADECRAAVKADFCRTYPLACGDAGQ